MQIRIKTEKGAELHFTGPSEEHVTKHNGYVHASMRVQQPVEGDPFTFTDIVVPLTEFDLDEIQRALRLLT